MPVFTSSPIGQNASSLEDAPASLWDSVKASANEAFVGNPATVGYDYLKFRSANQGAKLDNAAASEMVKSAGVNLQIPDDGYTPDALNLLIDRKAAELQRNSVISRGPTGFIPGASRFGAQLITGITDPLNIASAFIPVVGEANAARLFSTTTTTLARMGARAQVGAIQGAVGAAVVEPINYFGRTQMQDDYHMSDSLLNLAFGTVAGAGLHSIGGAVADAVRSIKGVRDPYTRFAGMDKSDIQTVLEFEKKYKPDMQQQQLESTISNWSSDMRKAAGFGERSAETDTINRPTPEINVAKHLPDNQREIETRFREEVAGDVNGAIERYEKLPDSENGKVLNTDVARDLSHDYAASNDARSRLSAAVHEPASWLVKEMYARKLQEDPKPGELNMVLFTGGGTGAGKTSAINSVPEMQQLKNRAQLVYDTNMNTMDGSVKKIDAALAAGKKVVVAYVNRDPVKALTEGALPRAKRMGRTVPLHEHANTHAGASETIHNLIEHYNGNENISFHVIDNTGGRGTQHVADIATVKKYAYNETMERLKAALDKEYKNGSISREIYNGTLGKDEARGSAKGPGETSGAREGVGSQGDIRETLQVLQHDDGGIDGRHPEGSQVAKTDGAQPSASEVISNLSPETRQAAFRTAAAQMVDGRMPDLDSILRSDPDHPFHETVTGAQLADVAEKQRQPETLAVGDRDGAEAANQRLAEAPKTERLEAAEASLETALKRIDDLKKNLEQSGVNPKLLASYDAIIAPFDQALKDAESFGAAARAAALCGLRS